MIKAVIDAYAQKIKLKDHADTCCKNVEVEVYNFDDAKLKFCQGLKTNSLKSVDAVYINASESKLFLIEMTSYLNYLTPTNKPTRQDNIVTFKEFVTVQTSSMEIYNKVFDSLLLIVSFAGLEKVDKKFYEYFFHDAPRPKKLSIGAYVLLDISQERYLEYTLGGITFNAKGISKRLCESIEIINGAGLKRLLDEDQKEAA
jgi:hypothetical protein